MHTITIDPILSQIDILELIPQRRPFVMVDKVLSCNETDAYTEFAIRQDNIFLDDTELSPAGIIENMAQSCAARMGCVNRKRGEAIKIGFIGDIRDCKITKRPCCDEVLVTHVYIVEEIGNLTLAVVSVSVGATTIASARMKIALVDTEG